VKPSAADLSADVARGASAKPMPTSLDILRTTFGYPTFRGQQAEIIEYVLAGGDCLVLMPTGGGKSLCYQIPALIRPGVGVIVSPLISLMQDQVAALRQLGIRASFLNSTLALSEARRIETQAARGELDLVYIAPERLLQERTLELLDRWRVALFAIDEAHCVSQWGHDFRPEYLQLSVLGERYPGIPRLACTATADERTRGEIVAKLALRGERIFVSGFDRPNIQYRIAQKRDPRRQLLSFLRREHPGDAGIVYCLSRKRVEEIAHFLASEGLTALPYHAGMDKEERQLHQERFQREDGVIIVATIAFGMGIDKPDVRFVAHLDLPKSIEAYYQETGRAGRDDLPATAWMVYGLQDVILLGKMIDDSEADDLHKRVERQRLEALLGYCELTTCRRQVLLRYFGDHLEKPCGNCDTCLHPVETFDGTVAAQKVLSCAVRTGQRFGAAYLIDVLLGHTNERIARLQHDRLPTFGTGAEFDAMQWRSVVRQLVARGMLRVDREGYGSLQVTDRARPVLRGAERVTLRRDLLREPEPAHPRARSRKRAALLSPGAGTGGGKGAQGLVSPLDLLPDAGIPEPQIDERLFDALRSLRNEIAKEQGVPAYVIFHDRTLAEMAAQRPVTEAQLLRIHGVGAAKLGRYGARFLDVIRAAGSGSAGT
jgi:ATP-dependent DNA helicase RecQ